MLATIQFRIFCLLLPFCNINVKEYRSKILPVVVYGCETWCLTLGEECRLRVSKNRVLRKILGPKREEVMEGGKDVYIIIHNEELRNCNHHQILW
jgi:hypothetical protein